MNIRVELTREEYEQTLLDLVNRVMKREISRSEIRSITVNYQPEATNAMTIVLDIPANTP